MHYGQSSKQFFHSKKRFQCCNALKQLFHCSFHINYRWNLKKRLIKSERIKNLIASLSKAVFKDKDITINPPDDAKCFEVYLLSFGPLYRMFFCVCSILALAFHGYFYCGCILYLFVYSSVLEQVLTALGRSGKLTLLYYGMWAAPMCCSMLKDAILVFKTVLSQLIHEDKLMKESFIKRANQYGNL